MTVSSTSRRPNFDRRRFFASASIHIPLLLFAVLMIFPFLWMVSTSLKSPGKQFMFPPELLPDPVYFQNFVDLFRLAHMGQYLFNSTKIATLSTIGFCLSSSLAAFAFARLRFPGREILFAILLGTMMLPFAVTMIPTFVIMRSLGWIDTHLPLIVPAFLAMPMLCFCCGRSIEASHRTSWMQQQSMGPATSESTGICLSRLAWLD